MRALTFLLPVIFAAGLCAQDKPLDLAVAYPATSLVYAEANLPALGDYATFQQVLAGLTGDTKAINPVSLLAAKLEIGFSKAELEALSSGSIRVSGALVDITLRGPKLQFVVEHKDLSALDKALREAAKKERPAFEGNEEYEGVLIHKLRLRFPRDAEAGAFGEMMPLSGMFEELEFGAAVYKNRYLVLAPNVSAAKDAIDGLQFPDDPLDTLLGNRRYTEAFKDFKSPGATLFVNIEAVINTAERIAGDKPDDNMMGWWLRSMLPGSGIDSAFAGSLTQYNQLKGFAAALWMPRGEGDADMAMRVEARLSFHNTPGWLSALRADPQPMPLLDVIPSDAIFALTANVQDGNKLYQQCKEFVQSRAREAGKPDAVKSLGLFDPEIETELQSLWKYARGGVSMVIVPTSNDAEMMLLGRVGGVSMVELSDWPAAEQALYDGLIKAKLLSQARAAESDLSPVEVLHGIEIHRKLDGLQAFAIMPGEGKKGVFIMGDAPAIRRVVSMHAQGRTLRTNPAFNLARKDMWPAHNIGLYVNGGAALEAVSGVFNLFSSFGGIWGWDEDEGEVPDRDDAELQRNPIPRLAEFFSGAAIVGGQRSGDALIELRFSAAGIPGAKRFTELAAHYRDVARNFEVRDDLLRVREAGVTWFALRSEPPTQVDALVESGYLVKPDWAIDPFGATETAPGARRYALAPAPKDVDIRQAVLLAYQAQPGLGGKRLAILWNNHVVTLTPEQLVSALDRATRGEALDETMYSVATKPLHEKLADSDGPSVGIGRVNLRRPVEKVEVVVIDDEGEEETIEVSRKDTAGEVEKSLDDAGKKEAPPIEEPAKD